jgi:hypothetical protein
LVITVKPALVTSDNPGQEGCIITGNLAKFLADVDLLLLVISCQNPAHRFGGNIMYVDCSSQNPLPCPITNFHLISKVLNGSTAIHTNKQLEV